jgi:hypothetical protein
MDIKYMISHGWKPDTTLQYVVRPIWVPILEEGESLDCFCCRIEGKVIGIMGA